MKTRNGFVIAQLNKDEQEQHGYTFAIIDKDFYPSEEFEWCCDSLEEAIEWAKDFDWDCDYTQLEAEEDHAAENDIYSIDDVKYLANGCTNYEEWGYKIETWEDSEIQESLDKVGFNKTIDAIKDTLTVIDGWS